MRSKKSKSTRLNLGSDTRKMGLLTRSKIEPSQQENLRVCET